MKKQREDEQVIDDGEERNGDGTKSDNPQKRDAKINRKREDEQVTVERSGDGMTSDDPQKRDDKINRKREDEQVIDDDVERSSDGTKSDDPQKREDKIKRKRKEMRTDLRMPEEKAKRSFGSGDRSRALSTDKAEEIMARTIAAPSTSNNPAVVIQSLPPPTAQAHSKLLLFIIAVGNAAWSFGSGDPSHALKEDEAEDIISQTISSMTTTTATPFPLNNPAGTIQAPSPRTAQASPLSKLTSIVTKCFKGAQ